MRGRARRWREDLRVAADRELRPAAACRVSGEMDAPSMDQADDDGQVTTSRDLSGPCRLAWTRSAPCPGGATYSARRPQGALTRARPPRVLSHRRCVEVASAGPTRPDRGPGCPRRMPGPHHRGHHPRRRAWVLVPHGPTEHGPPTLKKAAESADTVERDGPHVIARVGSTGFGHQCVVQHGATTAEGGTDNAIGPKGPPACSCLSGSDCRRPRNGPRTASATRAVPRPRHPPTPLPSARATPSLLLCRK